MKKKEFCGEIRVLKQLKTLIPPLSKNEIESLEASIVHEGSAHNPIWLWGDLLVDGHHRLDICKKHCLPYETKQVYHWAETLDDIEYCMKRDSIGRRNLPTAVQSRFRADMVKYHIKHGKKKADAVKLVAVELSVTPRQVHRDVAKEDALEKVDEAVKEVAQKLPEVSLRKLSELPKRKQRSVVKKSGGSARKLSKDMDKMIDSPEEQAKKIKSIATQHRNKLVVAIDDYHRVKPNYDERERLVKKVQSVDLW